MEITGVTMNEPGRRFLVDRAPVADFTRIRLPVEILVFPSILNRDFHCKVHTAIYPVCFESALRVRTPLGLTTRQPGKKPQVYVCECYGRFIV